MTPFGSLITPLPCNCVATNWSQQKAKKVQLMGLMFGLKLSFRNFKKFIAISAPKGAKIVPQGARVW